MHFYFKLDYAPKKEKKKGKKKKRKKKGERDRRRDKMVQITAGEVGTHPVRSAVKMRIRADCAKDITYPISFLWFSDTAFCNRRSKSFPGLVKDTHWKQR